MLGSNGAGKATTIKMLTTLLPKSLGEAYVAGSSITTQAVDVRCAIGYVPLAVSVDGQFVLKSKKRRQRPRWPRQRLGTTHEAHADCPDQRHLAPNLLYFYRHSLKKRKYD